jgi:hypothetical protein
MVARLILNNNALFSLVRISSPVRSITLTISGKKGFKRLEHMRKGLGLLEIVVCYSRGAECGV